MAAFASSLTAGSEKGSVSDNRTSFGKLGTISLKLLGGIRSQLCLIKVGAREDCGQCGDSNESTLLGLSLETQRSNQEGREVL